MLTSVNAVRAAIEDRAVFSFLQNSDDLLFRKMAAFVLRSLFPGQSELQAGRSLRGKVKVVLDDDLAGYNHHRPCQGRSMNGQTLAQVFLEGLPKSQQQRDNKNIEK